MPNTLLHLGVQSAVTRALMRDLDIRWVFLGCIIPDIPWIIRRILVWLSAPIDRLDMLLYVGVQASLAGCLLLAGVFACLARRPRLVFAVLAGNALVHLLLDAVEIKPGNGVHLFGPLSWRMTSFELIWPDNPWVVAVTAGASAVAIWILWRGRGRPIALAISPARILAAITLSALYLISPFILLDGLEAHDPYSVQTLRDVDERVGRDVSFDRRPFLLSDGVHIVITPGGETIRVLNPTITESGRVSMRGSFVAADAITVHEMHRITGWARDGFTYLGLSLVAGIWAWTFVAGSPRAGTA